MAVKRSTAVGHLREMAQSAQDGLRLRDADIGWPLEELWVTGELLDRVETLDAGTVVLSLDLPADELPWLAKHPTAEWIGSRLRLGKRPFWWFYRPLVWPAWNPAHRRVLRFWSATGGLDDRAIEALADRRLGDLTVVEPSAEIRREQLEVELAVSRRHLWRCSTTTGIKTGLAGRTTPTTSQRINSGGLPRGYGRSRRAWRPDRDRAGDAPAPRAPSWEPSLVREVWRVTLGYRAFDSQERAQIGTFR